MGDRDRIGSRVGSAESSVQQAQQPVSIPTAEIGEFKHVPHYNVRIAAQGYSNAAGVLAGFAFAAVVLLITIPRRSEVVQGGIPFQDWVTIAFLVAFFGSTLFAFVYSVVAAEEILSPRSNMIALFGAAGFSISASFVFWGLVSLVHLYLDQSVGTIAQGLFLFFSLIQPAFVTSVAFDNVLAFQRHYPELFPHNTGPSPTRLQWLAVVGAGFLPIVVSIVVRVFWWLEGNLFPSDTRTPMLFVTVIFGVFIIGLSGIFALIASYARHRFTLSPIVSALWILVQAVVIAMLVLLV